VNEPKPDPADAKSVQESLQPTSFIFVICQNGSETATKKEITDNHPNLRLAFSRPGFITFKVDSTNPLPVRFSLKSTLARTYGWSLGKCADENAEKIASHVAQEIAQRSELADCNDLHVWQRDLTLPGSKGFEPGITALAAEVGRLQLETIQAEQGRATDLEPMTLNRVAKPDATVIDVVLVEPNEWWYGFHVATTTSGRWPGGAPSFDVSDERISRAYYKLKEALLWSGISIEPGETCAEIGAAPGGASELVLELGAKVLAIDPAELEPVLLENDNLTYVRRRGHEVKKKDFRGVDWLLADINMEPKYTLDTVRDIVSHESVDIKGVILTMKLTDWDRVDAIPGWMKRIKEMGFQVVKAKQLAFNRRECVLIGVKDKFLLRSRKRKAKK
jgi:23S rRNA (cytidine2498-2'-O)-methyltransferase